MIINLKEKTKLLKSKKVILVLFSLLIALILKLSNRLIESYAYFNSGMELPIISMKIGNFSGKGDTSNLDQNTDVNLIFYVQNLMTDNSYYIAPSTPVIMSGYALNERKSNCIPDNATYEKYNDKDYKISEDGLVTVNISQEMPNQIVCRIYYDVFGSVNDLIVFALVENELGTVEYDGKTFAFESELPTTGYLGYKCKNENKDILTNINYDVTNGFSYETSGPNICYVYFSK